MYRFIFPSLFQNERERPLSFSAQKMPSFIFSPSFFVLKNDDLPRNYMWKPPQDSAVLHVSALDVLFKEMTNQGKMTKEDRKARRGNLIKTEREVRVFKT